MVFTKRQKIAFSSLAFLLTILFIIPTQVLATDTQIRVFVDGKSVVFDTPPIIKNNNVLLPLRTTGESLGARVDWDQQSQTITVTKGGMAISSPTDKTAMFVKQDLTAAQKKLSTDLLQLVDSKFLAPGQSLKDVQMRMQLLKQFIPGGLEESISGDKTPGDVVYVYIYTNAPADTHVIDPIAWRVTNRDEDNHLAAAWVEVMNLEKLASLDTIRNIRTVTPPTISNEPTTIVKLKLNSTTALVNGRETPVGAPACIVDNRVLVPLRFISESLGARVVWDARNYVVSISTTTTENINLGFSH